MQTALSTTLNQQILPLREGVIHALTQFKTALEAHFGDNLKGLYLFGSYASGEAHEESDVDVAVVLTIAEQDFWQVKRQLSDLAYEAICETQVQISSFPFSFYDWENPQQSPHKSLLLSLKPDAKELNQWLKL